jgi:hypothetical protein
VAREVKESMGVVSGKALIEEIMGEGGMTFTKCGSEGLGFGRLGAGRAIGVKGIADDEDLDFVLADEAGDGLKVGSKSGAMKCKERLRGETEGVCDGKTDAAITNVKREGARMWHWG